MAEQKAPAFHDLVRVCAVAQTQVSDGISLTLLSLELYDDGFMGVFRLIPSSGRPCRPCSHWTCGTIGVAATPGT